MIDYMQGSSNSIKLNADQDWIDIHLEPDQNILCRL